MRVSGFVQGTACDGGLAPVHKYIFTMDLSSQSPRRTPVFWKAGAALVLIVLAIGCKREEIRVYTVPKEREVEVASTAQDERASGAPHIHYKTPAGWVEERPGGIRVARFSIPAKRGPKIDVSVIPLPGITASKADVVNLWREQIRLGPAKEDELSGPTEKVTVGAEPAEMFDMVSTEPMIQDAYKARILVAMLSQGQTTWFFKMTGEDESVRDQKAAFVDFLKSVEIDYSSHAEPTPRVASAPPSRPTWKVPPTWKEVAPSRMLLAKFVMPDPKDPKAEVTVSVFPGVAGGMLPNVNWWRQQLKLEPLEDGALGQVSTPLDVSGGKGILVDMSGQGTNGRPTRIIGAILPTDEQTWFYKLTGDPQIAQQEKDAFVQFVQTAKYANAP